MRERVEATGLLDLSNGADLALHVDGGGTWQVDAPLSARRLAGQRVRLTGDRAGFDLVIVDRGGIEPV